MAGRSPRLATTRLFACGTLGRRRLITTIGTHTSPVLSVAFSPDGKQLVSGEHDIRFGFTLDTVPSGATALISCQDMMGHIPLYVILAHCEPHDIFCPPRESKITPVILHWSRMASASILGRSLDSHTELIRTVFYLRTLTSLFSG
jgi:WD40 repeat protein